MWSLAIILIGEANNSRSYGFECTEARPLESGAPEVASKKSKPDLDNASGAEHDSILLGVSSKEVLVRPGREIERTVINGSFCP